MTTETETTSTALDEVHDEYRRMRRGSEKRRLTTFAHQVRFFEVTCGQLHDELHDEDRELIPRSASPEMLIDAKQRIALAANQLASFADAIEDELRGEWR